SCFVHSLSPSSFFSFHATTTTEIYTLSLHDALPIFSAAAVTGSASAAPAARRERNRTPPTSLLLIHQDAPRHEPLPGAARISRRDRKSTRLNSSHLVISYAVFCLKKKK